MPRGLDGHIEVVAVSKLAALHVVPVVAHMDDMELQHGGILTSRTVLFQVFLYHFVIFLYF